MADDILDLTITELAPKIRDRQISPVEVTQAALARIEALRPTLNTFITVLHDGALANARQREQAILRGEYRGPLDGVPFGVKDNIATAGVLTTVGSKLFHESVPHEDAEVVARLKNAGAIMLGKENLLELASGGAGYGMSKNPFFGQVRNPWNTDYSTGGSSSGSGPNVAARMTFFSLGTDAGGSVRCPASQTGTVGMKQTFGRVSTRGLLMSPRIGDHICSFTRSVADSALLLQSLAGHDAQDPTSVPVPVPDYSAGLQIDLRGLVAGVPRHFYFDIIEPEIEAGVRDAIAALEELGVEIREVDLHTTQYLALAGIAGTVDGFVTNEPYLRNQRGDYSPELAARHLVGQFVSGADYVKSLRVQRLIREDFARALTEVDFLVAPSQIMDPTLIGPATFKVAGQEHSMDEAAPYMARVLSPANMTGLPSITVPSGLSAAGLPMGLQLLANPFEEALLYRVAAAYERVSPFHGKLAPI